jgi:hypothetical protein
MVLHYISDKKHYCNKKKGAYWSFQLQKEKNGLRPRSEETPARFVADKGCQGLRAHGTSFSADTFRDEYCKESDAC